MSMATNLSSMSIQELTKSSSGPSAGSSTSNSKKNSKKKKEKTLGEFGEFIIVQPYEVCVLVITDRDKFSELDHMLTGDVDEGFQYASGLSQVYDHPEIGHLFVMVVPNKYDEVTVWHEALHITHFVLEAVGVEVSKSHSSSEVQAYTQGHIVQMVKEECFTKRKKAPKKEA